MRAKALLLLLLLPPSQAAAAAEVSRIVAREHRGTAPWTVRAGAGGWSVERAGIIRRLDLPPGGRVDAIAAAGESFVVAGVRPAAAGGEKIWLQRGDREASLSPSSPAQPMAAEPVLVTAGERLRGIAWLEGRDRQHLAVRYAAAGQDGLSAPVTVAPPGPGSQLALAAATLADGRTLLVWSGYDGQDDEIWAALGGPSGWSSPRRITTNNAVPDITPDVVATPSGALVAWSRFDGEEYELVVAEFDGREFSAPARIGDPGSLYPTFEEIGGRLAVLFRDARRSTWSVIELSSHGKGGRRADALLPAGDRPLVRFGGDAIAWTDGSRAVLSAWE